MRVKRKSTEKICGVYSITNTRNNKRYIGSSCDIYGRWASHERLLIKGKHHSSHLQHAWDKYGKENFIFEILEECSQKELLTCEQKWYDFFESGNRNNGYNMSPIARTSILQTTTEDLLNGKRSITYEQFQKIVDLLLSTTKPYWEIANELHVSEAIIKNICYKRCYSDLTKDYVFQERYNNGLTSNVIIEEDVQEIIVRLQKGESCLSISQDYNVSSNTINDINVHKTWKRLTKDIVFPDRKRACDKSRNKKVVQYDKEGNYIKKFNSMRQASRELDIAISVVERLCQGKAKKDRGYTLRLEEENFNKYNDIQNFKEHRIDQYDLEGNFIKTFSSMKEANATLSRGRVDSVIQGKSKSAGGYYWCRHGEEFVMPTYQNKR